MLFAFGRHLAFRELSRGHWVVIVAVVAVVLLIRFWGPLVERVESWWRSR